MHISISVIMIIILDIVNKTKEQSAGRVLKLPMRGQIVISIASVTVCLRISAPFKENGLSYQR